VSEEVRAELRRRASESALRSYLDDLRASADVRVRQGREAAAQRGEAERSVGPREGGP